MKTIKFRPLTYAPNFPLSEKWEVQSLWENEVLFLQTEEPAFIKMIPLKTFKIS